jgi:hypothetical protein
MEEGRMRERRGRRGFLLEEIDGQRLCDLRLLRTTPKEEIKREDEKMRMRGNEEEKKKRKGKGEKEIRRRKRRKNKKQKRRRKSASKYVWIRWCV